MLILHAASINGRLVLWGEDSEAQPPDEQSIDEGVPPQHPGCASARLLVQSVDLKTGQPRIGQALAWLPSRGKAPIPSSPLAGPATMSRAKHVIRPWTVPCLWLAPEQVEELLRRCGDRRALKHGVGIGADLAYWRQALSFAISLTARQRFLPSVARQGSDMAATWTPVIVGDDAHRLAELGKLMPQPARSMTEPGASGPPRLAAQSVLREFVASLVDFLVRPQGLSEEDAFEPDSVHDAWLHALSSHNQIISGDRSDVRKLRQQIADWQRPIAIATNSPFRLCLRLEEPPRSEDEDKPSDRRRKRWNLRYLLQPHDDYSLLINASDIWTQKARDDSGYTDLREFLLSSLAQTAMDCPPIAASLKRREPDGCKLNDNQAHRFLSQQAAVLQQSGFGVLLPAWWTRQGTKTKAGIQAKVKTPTMKGGSGMSMETLLELDVEVAIGDSRITPEELDALADLKVPLVRHRGEWVEIDAAAIRAAAAYWGDKKNITLRDALQIGLGADPRAQSDNVSLAPDDWISGLLDRLNQKGGFEEIDAPVGFIGQLRPYQQLGYSWLAFLMQWGLGACLADDMGLGKTVQTLAALQLDRQQGSRLPNLLVCPTSVINNWQREADKFTPELSVLLHHGPKRKRGAEFEAQAASHHVVITSYNLMARDIKQLAAVPWRSVILDEAQNIKNPLSKQAAAARGIRADYRIALTGTPVENHVGDLWSLMEFLNPGLLGTQAEFKRRYFLPIQTRKDENAATNLQNATGPFILRRLKTDKDIIDDLPDKHETKQYCNLTKEQVTLYEAVVREAATRLEDAQDMERRGCILDTLTKLKQVCNHPRQLLGDNSVVGGRSGKLARLEELMDEIMASDDRVLIFSQFAEMGAILQQHLQETYGLEVPFLHGGVTRSRRVRMVDRFQNDPDGPLAFVLSLKAGGSGLNLPRANHVIHYDRWWNPAAENQATDRAFRIGQTKDVHVHKLICAGTLEDRIDMMIEAKTATAEQVVGATSEGWLTELTNEELRDILALRATAAA